MTIPWERNFERALISFFTLPSGFQVTGFHCDSGLLVFRATSELGRRVWGLGNLKCHALLFLPRCGCFSWLYAPQIAKKPLVNFQSFEKVDHNNFCKCLNWFHGREFFFFLNGYYFAILLTCLGMILKCWNQPCIYGLCPFGCLWCVVLFICSWIQFENIWLSTFVFTCMRNFGL